MKSALSAMAWAAIRLLATVKKEQGFWRDYVEIIGRGSTVFGADGMPVCSGFQTEPVTDTVAFDGPGTIGDR
tara:strand:- start:22 stop:237 length:216 start_codon:yes stop_codon:yes gene_type:complete